MCPFNKLIVFVCCAYLAGCSPRAQSFDYNKHVNKHFFSAVGSIDRQENLMIDSVHVYSARFIEVLDEKDGLLEYKLYNEASSALKPPLKEIIGNSQQLFFFRLFSKPVRDIGIYLSVKFNASGKCIGFGPSYFGHIRMNKVNIDRILRIKKNDESFLLKDVKKFDMFLECDTNLLAKQFITRFSIQHIVQDGTNKIGGHKDLVFDINAIFNDPQALEFTFKERILF